VVLASQIAWSESCENALQAISSSSNQKDLEPMLKVLRVVEATLNILADSVLQEQPPVRRRKLEHLVSLLLFYGLLSIYADEDINYLKDSPPPPPKKKKKCIYIYL